MTDAHTRKIYTRHKKYKKTLMFNITHTFWVKKVSRSWYKLLIPLLSARHGLLFNKNASYRKRITCPRVQSTLGYGFNRRVKTTRIRFVYQISTAQFHWNIYIANEIYKARHMNDYILYFYTIWLNSLTQFQGHQMSQEIALFARVHTIVYLPFIVIIWQ